MNATIKTVLLTILTLSLFTIAMVELSGVSQTAFINKLKGPKLTASEKQLQAINEQEAEAKSKPKTTFSMPEPRFDFGTINEGDKVRHDYKIINTGNNPLFIGNVQVSCGCTAPQYPKKPLAPGEEGVISLEFNSKGKEGKVNKSALVVCNADNSPFSFGFTADVKK